MITVVERIAALGLEPDQELAWRVGAAIRRRWVEAYRDHPATELQPAATASGSSPVAVYPSLWKHQIDSLIHDTAAKLTAERDHQLTIWGGYDAKL